MLDNMRPHFYMNAILVNRCFTLAKCPLDASKLKQVLITVFPCDSHIPAWMCLEMWECFSCPLFPSAFYLTSQDERLN